MFSEGSVPPTSPRAKPFIGEDGWEAYQTEPLAGSGSETAAKAAAGGRQSPLDGMLFASSVG